MTENARAHHVFTLTTCSCFWCGFSQAEIEDAYPRLKLCPDKRNAPNMTKEDSDLIVALCTAIRHSPQGKRLKDLESALDLAIIAHHAIRDRLPRLTA